MIDHVVIRQASASGDEFRVIVKGKNNRTLLTSETYNNRADALRLAGALGVPVRDHTRQ